MSGIANKIRAWRYGQTGITGLNEMRNNLTMLIVVLAPFIGLWIAAQYIVNIYILPLDYAIRVWLAPTILIGSIGLWLVYCLLYWTYVRNDANQFKVCPQTPTFMPDGSVRKFTFKIPPDGIKKECEFDDGSIGITITFADRYLFQDRRMQFPYTFWKGSFIIPASIGESFNFISSGEFWHKGMVVETPNCEHPSFYIREFLQQRDGSFRMVGVIGDCTYRHQQFIKGNDGEVEQPELPKQKQYEMLYLQKIGELDELDKYTQTLEERIEADESHARKYKKSVGDGISTILDAVHTWDELEESLVKRIFTWKNIFYVIIVIAVVYALLHFLMGVI